MITTDELDPLRDEGLAYLRALQRAGVDATGHTYNGVVHGGELLAAAATSRLVRAGAARPGGIRAPGELKSVRGGT